MSEPIIDLAGVTRAYGGLRPLRVAALSLATGDRVVLAGFDAGAAEAFVHLVTGALLPEAGEVRIAGRPTSAIATDTDWLTSLDRFGLVTDRAVLIDQLPVAANLALPITLAIDPIPADARGAVEQAAADVGLAARLDAPVAELGAAERARLHLARAVIARPAMVILEHPTARIDRAEDSAALGETLAALADRRAIGFVALSEDEAFARATGARRLRLHPASGRLAGDGARRWWRW